MLNYDIFIGAIRQISTFQIVKFLNDFAVYGIKPTFRDKFEFSAKKRLTAVYFCVMMIAERRLHSSSNEKRKR